MLKETVRLLDLLHRRIQAGSHVSVCWNEEGLMIEAGARVGRWEFFRYRQLVPHEDFASTISEPHILDIFVKRFNQGYRDAVTKEHKEG